MMVVPARNTEHIDESTVRRSLWKKRLEIIGELITATLKQALSDDIPKLGAALAFYAMLSIVPMLVLLVGLGSFFYGHEVARDQIHTIIIRFAGNQEADTVQNILDASQHYAQMSRGTAIFNIAILLYGASGVFNQLQDTLNLIWRAPPRKGTAFTIFVKENVFSYFIVFGVGLLLIVSVILNAALTVGIQYAVGLFPSLGKLAQFCNAIFGWIVMSGIYALAFRFIPNRKILWKDVWLGAALTALLSLVGQLAVGFYLGHSNLAAGYGAGGSLVALLIWLYYFAQIFFFGATFTQIYAERYGDAQSSETK